MAHICVMTLFYCASVAGDVSWSRRGPGHFWGSTNSEIYYILIHPSSGGLAVTLHLMRWNSHVEDDIWLCSNLVYVWLCLNIFFRMQVWMGYFAWNYNHAFYNTFSSICMLLYTMAVINTFFVWQNFSCVWCDIVMHHLHLDDMSSWYTVYIHHDITLLFFNRDITLLNLFGGRDFESRMYGRYRILCATT